MIVGELAPLDDEDVGADQAIPLLERRLRSANQQLTTAMRENPKLAGMGSTTIAVLRTGTKLALAHIGDSRAFLLRGDSFTQITKDHSFVQQLVDEGRLSKEDAGSHPQRSVVTRVMTGQPEDEPDTSLREAKVGDRVLLCSDGLSDFVGAQVIEEILREAAGPAEAADRCIEVALKASTRDNVTVIVAEVVDADDNDLPPTVPEVVGAAARLRGRTRAIPVSPAEKAAALSRDTRDTSGTGGAAPDTPGDGRAGKNHDDDDEHDEPGGDARDRADLGPDGDGVELAEESRRGAAARIARRTIGGLVIIAVLGVGTYAAWTWSQRQFFIGVDGGRVAIFRGVSQSLGPIQLSHVETPTTVLVTDLPSDLQTSLENTIAVNDLADAHSKVDQLWIEAFRCRVLAATGTACGTTPGALVTPVPTVPATGSTLEPGVTPGAGTTTGVPASPSPRFLPSTPLTPPARAQAGRSTSALSGIRTGAYAVQAEATR